MKNFIEYIKTKVRQNGGFEPSLLQHTENNLQSATLFRQRLLIEKRRAERLNTVTTLLVFNAGKVLNSNDNRAVDNDHAITETARSICSRIRETDVVSVYQEKILILLPDTDEQAAHCVYKRLITQLSGKQLNYNASQTLNLGLLEMRISTFPEKPIGEQLPEEAMILQSRASRPNGKKALPVSRDSNARSFDQNGTGRPNLSMSGSSIALQFVDPLSLDQEFIADFILSLEKAFKRAVDIFGALAGLILLSPFFVITAVLVKATSKGPVLFRQTRSGYKGKPFTFLKFRSMFANSDDRSHQAFMKRLINGQSDTINNGSQDDPLYKMKGDPRITPIGKFLRKTSIDELPQLLNVLKGEMSLIGPRPPIPYEVEEYQMWHHRRLSEVKPGITGLWQVSGRNKTTFDEMVRLDLHYARNWSLGLDFSILFKTVKVVFGREGM